MRLMHSLACGFLCSIVPMLSWADPSCASSRQARLDKVSSLRDAGYSEDAIVQYLVGGCTAAPSTSSIKSPDTTTSVKNSVQQGTIQPAKDLSTSVGLTGVMVSSTQQNVAATTSTAAAAGAAGTVSSTTGTDAKSGGGVPSTSVGDFFKDWNLGFALMKNRSTVVPEATIVNDIVRGGTIQQWQSEILLSKHYYFSHSTNDETNGTCLWGVFRSCPGVFVGVGFGGSGSSQFIDMVGGGIVIGFGNNKTTPKASDLQKFTVGIGIGRRFGVKTLGDGFALNSKPPTGETQVRYKTTDFTAPFLFMSYALD